MSRGTFQGGAKPTWKKVFFEIFLSDFEQKLLGLCPKSFWPISKKAFNVSRGTVCEKRWVKKNYEAKIFWGTFWQISDIWWKISGRFVKTAFSLSGNFLGKIIILDYIFDWYFFWTLNANCQGFGETFSASFYKLLSTCPKEKRMCCPTFEDKTLFLEVFVVFKGLTDTERSSFSLFYLIFGKVLKVAL